MVDTMEPAGGRMEPEQNEKVEQTDVVVPEDVVETTASPDLWPKPKRYRSQIVYDTPPTDTPIGVVVPFDFNLDWEYWKYLPPDVALHFTRTPFLPLKVGVSLARGVGRPAMVGRATRALAGVNPSTVLYACSSGSFVGGVVGEAEIVAAMLGAGAQSAVTTSGAMVQALDAVGARRIALATPYTAGLTRRLVTFLDEAGFDVVATRYLGLKHGIAGVSRATVSDLVRTAASDADADAVFVSCTALRTYGIVAHLEHELDLPVFTSNQVSLWAALVAAGALPRRPDVAQPEWVLGDADPVAQSTALLMQAAHQIGDP